MSFFASERWVHRLRSVTVTPPYRHFDFRGRKIHLIFFTLSGLGSIPLPHPRFLRFRLSASREEEWWGEA